MIRASIICDTNKKSFRTKFFLQKKIKLFPIAKSNLIIVVGGDGFMLQTLKKFYKFKKPFLWYKFWQLWIFNEQVF